MLDIDASAAPDSSGAVNNRGMGRRGNSLTGPSFRGDLMNLAKRLALLLAVPLVALVLLGLILYLQLRTIEDRGKYVADLQVQSLAIIGHATRTFGEMRWRFIDFLV